MLGLYVEGVGKFIEICEHSTPSVFSGQLEKPIRGHCKKELALQKRCLIRGYNPRIRMKHYEALEDREAQINLTLGGVMAPTLGAHRASKWLGGRLLITNYNLANCRATATSVQAGMTWAVNPAALPTGEDFLSVSGLTSCIGVQVLRKSGGSFVHGVTAHFNSSFDVQTPWKLIAAGVAGIEGSLHAIVTSTSDTSNFWQEEVVIGRIGGYLRGIGVSDDNILYYHSCRGCIAYFIRRDGVMGEPYNTNHHAP